MAREPARHQKLALTRLQTWWKSKAETKAHGFVAMPTGSGKTFTAVRFTVDEILSRRHAPCVVWVAHNEFLLAQAEREFRKQLEERNLVDIEIARAHGDGTGSAANLIFAMIQTLARGEAGKEIQRAGDVDLVVFDEFHRLAADTWSAVPKTFQRAGIRTLGLSATPFRKTADKTRLLRKLLPHRIFSVGLMELVKDEFLAAPKVTRVVLKSARPLELSSKELSHLRQFHALSASALERIAGQAGRDQLILETYRRDPTRYGSTIIFCCSVDHASALASTFSIAGIPAESICGSSRDDVNVQKLQNFRDGKFSVATSVVLLTEGVDVPRCRTVFLARPTESPVLLTQMIGRAMRGISSGGSATCNIVDFVDNLGDGVDLAATHFAFVRDFDERIRPIIIRKPNPKAAGVSLSLLLRVREFLSQHIVKNGASDPLGTILRQELAGWLELWDGELHRVLLIPHRHGKELADSLEKASQRISRLGRAAAGEAAEVARAVYDDDELDANGVSEEDFTAIAVAQGTASTEAQFHALGGPAAITANGELTAAADRELTTLELELVPTGAAPDFVDVFAAMRSALRSG